MSYIIGDLGYTYSACSDLIKLIQKVSETGSLEDFLKFQDELDLAITNKDYLSDKEIEIISEIMEKDNYFRELGTGEHLYVFGDFSDYADEIIKEEGYDTKYCDPELLKNIFLEGLEIMGNYIHEEEEKVIFEANKKKKIIREYDLLTRVNSSEVI